MQNQLTEAEAWRMIGEAFEAKAAHPELDDEVVMPADLAWDGMCSSIDSLDGFLDKDRLYSKVDAELGRGWGYLEPTPYDPGGAEARAMLAYLFAEEAAA